MIGPDLCGYEHVIPAHARGAQAVADLALVVIGLGRIEMAVAEPQGLLDKAGAGPTAQFPGPQPDRRNSGTVGLDELHVRTLRLRGRIMSRRGHAANAG